jgi:hypothetical protein
MEVIMIPEYKICPKCQENKHSSSYHTRNDRGYLYLKSYCKKCSNKLTVRGQYDKCKCGNPKTKKSSKCIDCHNKNQKQFVFLSDVKHYQKYGKQVTFQPIRSRARSVIKDRTCCEKCGYDKHVEACHIKPISSFPDDTPIDLINSPDNLLALCPNCHWEFDNIK